MSKALEITTCIDCVYWNGIYIKGYKIKASCLKVDKLIHPPESEWGISEDCPLPEWVDR